MPKTNTTLKVLDFPAPCRSLSTGSKQTAEAAVDLTDTLTKIRQAGKLIGENDLSARLIVELQSLLGSCRLWGIEQEATHGKG